MPAPPSRFDGPVGTSKRRSLQNLSNLKGQDTIDPSRVPEGFIERRIIMNSDLRPIMTPVAKRPFRRAAGGQKNETPKTGAPFVFPKIARDHHHLSTYRFTGHIPFPGIHDSGAAPLARNPRTQTWVDDHRSPIYLSGEGRGGNMNRMERYVMSATEYRSSNLVH